MSKHIRWDREPAAEPKADLHQRRHNAGYAYRRLKLKGESRAIERERANG